MDILHYITKLHTREELFSNNIADKANSIIAILFSEVCDKINLAFIPLALSSYPNTDCLSVAAEGVSYFTLITSASEAKKTRNKKNMMILVSLSPNRMPDDHNCHGWRIMALSVIDSNLCFPSIDSYAFIYSVSGICYTLIIAAISEK